MQAKVEHAGQKSAYVILPSGFSRKMATHDAQRIAAEANEQYRRLDVWDNDPAWRSKHKAVVEVTAEQY